MRAAPLVLLAFILAKVAVSVAQQPRELSEAEKRRLFLRAREEMRTVPATPRRDPTPRPIPKPARPPITPEPKPARTPVTPEPEPKRTTPEASPTAPAPKRTTPDRPKVTTTPPPQPQRPPTRRPQTTPAPAPVVVEKTLPEGYQPPPPRGWFQRWRYLTKPIRAAIDRPKVQRGRWRYIVVHNSATRQGSAKAFEYYHKNVRKMPNGLAYHFVIGNGTSTGLGQIEIGNRWHRQINGGHVHSDYLNNISIGICLVGDYNRDVPKKEQLAALEELIRYLRIRVGRIDGRRAIVKPHRAINPPRWPTDCPGDRFPYRWLSKEFD